MEFFMLIILLVGYFLPAIIAGSREHPSAGAIFFLNLVLGWTLLGWIVCFVWSFTNPAQVVVNEHTSKSAAEEIRDLAGLREQGLLTDEEFNRKKRQILDRD